MTQTSTIRIDEPVYTWATWTGFTGQTIEDIFLYNAPFTAAQWAAEHESVESLAAEIAHGLATFAGEQYPRHIFRTANEAREYAANIDEPLDDDAEPEQFTALQLAERFWTERPNA